MPNPVRTPCACALLIGGALFLSSPAHAFDLTGAWATSADQCGKIFIKKDGQVSFARYSEEFGGGFVATPKEIRSKSARCVIKSRKESGNTIDLEAACVSEIMTSSAQFPFKFLNNDTVVRFFSDPDMKDMQITYSRCPM
jgi:hypothetical protein